jgi:hypothetical protein
MPMSMVGAPLMPAVALPFFAMVIPFENLVAS